MKNKLIGIYELITGVTGILLLLFSFFRELLNDSKGIFPSFILGIILFGMLTYSGFALIRKKIHGRKYSIALQAVQIFSFIYAGTKYLFSASAFLSVVINNGIHFKFNPDIIAYSVERVPELLPFELRIFIVPVIILILLISR